MSESITSNIEPLQLEVYDSALFENQILKVDELAEYLKSSSKTIYKMALRGDIPSIRVGRSYRFLLPDVLRSLKTGERNGKRI